MPSSDPTSPSLKVKWDVWVSLTHDTSKPAVIKYRTSLSKAKSLITKLTDRIKLYPQWESFGGEWGHHQMDVLFMQAWELVDGMPVPEMSDTVLGTPRFCIVNQTLKQAWELSADGTSWKLLDDRHPSINGAWS